MLPPFKIVDPLPNNLVTLVHILLLEQPPPAIDAVRARTRESRIEFSDVASYRQAKKSENVMDLGSYM